MNSRDELKGLTNKDIGTIQETFLDKKWRMNNLYWIKDKKGNSIKLKLNFFQELLLSQRHSRNIVLKARQLGCSTFIVLHFFDECLFSQNTSAAVVADRMENSKMIFAKIDFAWKNLNGDVKDFLGLTAISDSKTVFEWSNGSLLRAETSLHSGTYQFLHLSEYGPLCAMSEEKALHVKKSALPTVDDASGEIWIESTGEGEGNDYHKMCVQARTEDDERFQKGITDIHHMQYKLFFLPWFKNPEYETTLPPLAQVSSEITTYCDNLEKTLSISLNKEKRAWYYLKKKELKKVMGEQYPSTFEEAFFSDTTLLFDVDVIKRKIREEAQDTCVDVVDGDIKIFKSYQLGHVYGIGADVADGIGRDSSTAVVIDFTSREVCATYKDNSIDAVSFAHVLAKIGTLYGGCIIAPENARTGHTTCVILNDIYPNIYTYERKGYQDVRVTVQLGWTTSSTSKARMLNELKSSLYSEKDDSLNIVCVKQSVALRIPDVIILREMMMFGRKDVFFNEAQKIRTTRHFDLLIATAIAWQMKDVAQAYYGKNNEDEKRRVAQLHLDRENGKNGYD